MFVVAATLILLPIALSPVSSDPAVFGQTALLLAAITALHLILAVRELTNRNKNHDLIRGSFVKGISGFGSLFLIILLIVTSRNWTVALTSPQAKVVLVLLFFLAARRLLAVIAREHSDRGNLDRDRSLDSARDDRCGQIASEALAMTKSGYPLIKKAWLSGLIVFGLLYLIFGSPLAVGIEATSRALPRSPRWAVPVWYQSARSLVAPQFNPIRPDWQTSLKVATKTLVNSPLLGVGLGHYSEAFSAYRGSAFNATPLWNYKYTSSFSTLFNWVTEGGIVGLVIYLLLFLPGFIFLFAITKKIVNVIPSAAKNLPRMRVRTSREILRRALLRMTVALKSLSGIISARRDDPCLVKVIVTSLTVVSLFFPFSLAGYFYLVTGYLFIYEN